MTTGHLFFILWLSALFCPLKSQEILFNESFDEADLTKNGWYDESRIIIAGDARAGQGCIEYEWDQELKSSGSASIRHLFEPSGEVYIRFYLKLSKDWGWTGRNYHPHLTHFMTTENSEYHGPAASHLTLYVEPVNGKLRLAATDIQNSVMPHGLTQGELKGGYNGMLYDSDEVLFNDEKWHCIEAYFRLNTLDMENDRPNPDGIVRGWFDNELVIDHTDVILRSTDFPEMRINQFLMAPYFGPGLLPHAQKLWIDELTVGTNRADYQISTMDNQKKYIAFSSDTEAYFTPRDFENFQGEFTGQIMEICRTSNIPFTWLVVSDEAHTEMREFALKVYPVRSQMDEFSLHVHFKWFIMDSADDFASFQNVDRRLNWLKEAKTAWIKAGVTLPLSFRYGGGDSNDSCYCIEDLIFLYDEFGIRNYLFDPERLPGVRGITRLEQKGNNVWIIDGNREMTLLSTCVYLDEEFETIRAAIDQRLETADYAIIGSHDYREVVPGHLKQTIEYLNAKYNTEYVTIDAIGELVRRGEIRNR